ncbi:MAG: hypothetical protein IPK19_15615 [Chloroflexi bacterium]|nr:hypothetical protein [Chloroflexota bacterium]
MPLKIVYPELDVTLLRRPAKRSPFCAMSASVSD